MFDFNSSVEMQMWLTITTLDRAVLGNSLCCASKLLDIIAGWPVSNGGCKQWKERGRVEETELIPDADLRSLQMLVSVPFLRFTECPVE